MQASQNQAVQATEPQLSVGQRIQIAVLEILDNAIVVDLNGQTLIAKQADGLTLQVGDTISAEVQSQTDNTLHIKVLPQAQDKGTEAQLVKSLEGQLQKLDLPVSEKNIQVLKAMHQQGLPIDKATAVAIGRDISALATWAKEQQANSQTNAINWQATLKESAVSHMQATSVNSAPQTINTQQQTALNTSFAPLTDTTNAKPVPQPSAAVTGESRQAVTSQVADKTGQPVKVNQSLSANLADSFNQAMLKFAAQPLQQQAQTFSFMQGQQIPITMFSTALTSQLLSGNLGVMANMLELLQSSEAQLPEDISVSVQRLVATTPNFTQLHNDFNAEDLRQMIEDTLKIQQFISQTKISSQNGDKTEQATVLKQVGQLLTDAPINWQAIQLPIQVRQQVEDIEIYIKGDPQKGGRLNPDDGLVYIALNTVNLDTVRVKLHFKKAANQIEIITTSQRIKDYITQLTDDLYQTINALTDRPLAITVTSSQHAPDLAELSKIPLEQLGAVDIKV